MADRPNTTPFPIEHDIPTPTPRRGKRRYPFECMEIGDSFAVPIGDRNGKSLQASVMGAAKRCRPMRFTSRLEAEFVRIWRVE